MAGSLSNQLLNPPPVRKSARRLLALDQLRGFVIVLVVLHHAILAYCTFGHVSAVSYALSTAPIVDLQRWSGFDAAVKLNDGFFMPLLFLLSGLFVLDSLVRKGAWHFLRGRLLRLGVPFCVAELTVVPLAYYPSFLQAGGAPGFLRYWGHALTVGPWPSGPPWFIGVLLMFDATVAFVFFLSPWSSSEPDPRGTAPPGPGRCFGILLASSVLLYLPLLFAFGSSRWLSVGPLAVQASRILLYAAYFAAGGLLGAAGIPGIVRLGAAVARQWLGWLVLWLLAGVVFVEVSPLGLVKSIGLPVWSGLVLAGLLLPVYCAIACFGVMALFLRFGGCPGPVWTSLAANSFAIYLLHYPVVTWLQSALLPLSADATVKGMVTFIVALVACWGGAALLRLVPGVARVV